MAPRAWSGVATFVAPRYARALCLLPCAGQCNIRLCPFAVMESDLSSYKGSARHAIHIPFHIYQQHLFKCWHFGYLACLLFREAPFPATCHFLFPPPAVFLHLTPTWHPGVICRKGRCLYRLGEASHPGPRIVTANLSSLTQGWSDLAALQWDIALVQEARVSHGSSILADIRRAGCQVILSSPEGDGNSLLAIIVRCGSVVSISAVLGPGLWVLFGTPGVVTL